MVIDNAAITTTDYAGAYDYVYQYKDQVNNVRLSYSDLNGDGSIDPGMEILHERNYYPFGMFHSGYNNAITGVKNNLKTYQDQEFTDDLELNIHEWRFRFSDPAIGRFWSIDPLAEDYSYQSPYNFSENRVIDGFELEGLEYVTMHHIMNGGKYITTIPVEHYKETDAEINVKNGTSAGSYNAASHGPEGKGVKHVYHNRDASYTGPYKDGAVRWDNQRKGFSSRAGTHGLYSGPGSITGYAGKDDYDFSFQPIDYADAIAKRHDEDYASATASGEAYAGYIEDVRTYQADVDMVNRLDAFSNGEQVNGIDTPYRTTSSGEMKLAIKGQKLVIGVLRDYKKWKIDNNYGNNDKFDQVGSQLRKDNFKLWAIIYLLSQNKGN